MCKKLLVFILCAVMVFSTAACDQNTERLADPNSITVWVPTICGKKYHSNPRCSNMKSPELITLSEAITAGFGECNNCH